jgi:hypothetical protein
MLCPECNGEMRAIKSMGIDLCDSCGHSLPIEGLPEPTIKPKRKKVNYLPLALMLGIGGLGITAIAISAFHQRSVKLAEIAQQKEFDAKVKEAEEAIAEMKASIVDTTNLPATCKRKEDYQLRLTRAVFMECLPSGLTYSQTNQILGTPGVMRSSSGNTQMFEFSAYGDGAGQMGYMNLIFQDNRLISKSEYGLSTYP